MAEQHEEIAKLLIGYVTKSLSTDDQQKLDNWINSSASNRAWLTQWDRPEWIAGEVRSYDDIDLDKGIAKIWDKINAAGSRRTRMTKSFSIIYVIKCAAAIIVVSIGVWWFTLKKQDSEVENRSSVAQSHNGYLNMDSLLAQKQATIKLHDGTMRVLDSMADGASIAEPGCLIKKENGILNYYPNDPNSSAPLTINQIVAGRCTQIQIRLPDKSKVWLNAGTSIGFAIAGAAGDRSVNITGEAFFEVHPDKLRPFKVRAKETTIQAVGTQFNVYAYADDNEIKTTLLEGSVQVATPTGNTMLNKVGQTALVNKTNKISVVEDKDATNIVSWKSGNFRFENVRLVNVMAEIKRWYGVDIVYKDTPSVYFTYTAFRRSFPLDSAIRHITQNDTRLTIRKDGNSLILSSK